MNFLSVLYAKAGITVDGVTTLNNTATGQTPATNDNSTKLATTGYVKNQNYYPYPTGTTSQYVRGDGSLATFTQTGGGGSSVSYYLNGGTSQGTIGGNTYYEMSKTAVVGTNADFTINANGYIAQFVTDAGDPALLNIPGGNWNFEMFFSASSGGGSPSFYVELYKYNGTTLTLIASGSAVPESITGGTSIDLYVTALAVPTTTLTLTDRLAVRVYVTHSGRTITLHTQDSHLCQVITTFTTGLTALNGLTAQVQNFAVGAGGSDFNISSVTDTHTFNLPTASATKRGALSFIDWSAFDAKVDFGDLSATSPLSYNGSGVFSIAQSSASTNGYLSSTDWTTFNNKIGGSGTANYIAKFTSGSVVGNSLFYSDANVAKTIYGGVNKGLYIDFNEFEEGQSTDIPIITGSYQQFPNALANFKGATNNTLLNHNFYSRDGLSSFSFGQLYLEDSDAGGWLNIIIDGGGFQALQSSLNWNTEEGFNLNNKSNININTNQGNNFNQLLFTQLETYFYFQKDNTSMSLYFDTDNFKISTKHNGNNIGLYIDFDDPTANLTNNQGFGIFSINNEIFIGDKDGNIEGTKIYINPVDNIIKTSDVGGDKGLYLDFANSVYTLGQQGDNNTLKLDCGNNIFQLGRTDNFGLYLDLASSIYKLGDYNWGSNTGTAFIVDDSNAIIKTSTQGVDKGLYIDYPNYIYALGFTDGGNPFTDPVDGFVYTNNYTTIGSVWNWGEYIEIKHLEQRIYLETNRLHYRNLTTTQINALTGNQEGDVTYNNTTHSLYFYNGTTWGAVSSGGTVTGTGTTNYITKFTSGSVVGNSIIYDNGTNVGIGTTSPSARLHVSGGDAILRNAYIGEVPTYGAGNSQFSHISRAGAGEYSFLSDSVGETYVNAKTGYNIYFRNNNNNLAIITPVGNVGIGTTNPANKFVIKGGATYLEFGTGTDYADILAFNRDTVAYKSLILRGSDIRFSPSDVEKMRLVNNGNLLIGTTTDAGYKLDVNGNVRIATSLRLDGLDTSGYRAIGFGGNTLGTNPTIYSNGSYLVVNSASGQSLYLNSDSTGNVLFPGGGNVGIKTTSPIDVLHVVGGISSTSLSNTLNGSIGSIQMGYDGTNGVIRTWNSSPIIIAAYNYQAFETTGAERMRIATNGYVGVGTATPLYRLESTTTALFGTTAYGVLNIAGDNPAYIKIKTNIPFSYGAQGYTVNIKGFQYGSAQTLDLQVCWHQYTDAFYSQTITSKGSFAPVVRLARESGLVVIVLTWGQYWPKLYVESVHNYINDGYANGWTWVDENVTGDKTVTLSYKNDFGDGFVKTAAGNVGIGTTNPTQKLDVIGQAAIGSGAQAIVGTDGTYAGYSTIGFGGTTNGYNRVFGHNATSDGLYLAAATGNSIWFWTNGSNLRMVIDSSGNVGIGTTSPASKFQVVTATNENVSLGSLSAIPTGRTLILQTDAAGGSIETYSSLTSGYVPLLLNPNGANVLIGTTTNAGYKLDVNGTARVQGALSTTGFLGIGISPDYAIRAFTTNASGARVSMEGTTNFVCSQFTNTGGSMYFGIDDSAGSNFTGTGYKRFLYSGGTSDFGIYTNGVERFTINGSTGAATFASSVKSAGFQSIDPFNTFCASFGAGSASYYCFRVR